MSQLSILSIAITKEQFEAEGNAEVYGTANPSIMENQVWKWMISTLDSAWSARISFNPNNGFPKTPDWCFQRFGQTETTLPDGRVVYIAGEHEDGYDPDFFIYNDVVVFDKSPPEKEEDITIYGYPTTVFLPTDNHTATYVPGYECIYIIGGIGYMNSRHRKEVVVQCLDLGDFSIREVKTKGEKPGAYLANHTAQLLPAENGATGKIRVILSQEEPAISVSDSEDELDPNGETDGLNPDEDGDGLKEEALMEVNIRDGETAPDEDGTIEEEENSGDEYEETPPEPEIAPRLPSPKVYSLDLDTLTWTCDDAK